MSKTKAAVKKETLEALHGIVEQAKTARLTPAQEEEAAARIKDLLVLGRASIAEAVEAMFILQWNVGVAAVTGLWPEMKPLARKAMLGMLAAQKSDSAKRLRLSLARGLFALEPEIAAQMAAEVCEEMRAEGTLTGKDRMIFSNVLVGKGKPWLLHFPLAEWKAEQGDALVACAIETCFGAPCAPFTQISLLRWAAEAGRLAALPEDTLAAIAKIVKRWNPRFRKELKNEVPELPGPIAAAVAAPPAAERKSENANANETSQRSEGWQSEAGRAEPAEQPLTHETNEPDESWETAATDERRPDDASPQYPPYVPRSQPASSQPASAQPRSARRGSGGAGEGAFDLNQTLRQIETHVMNLRRELRDAQSSLRHQQREDRPSSRGRSDRRGYREAAEQPATPVELDELRRHNAQLEETGSRGAA